MKILKTIREEIVPLSSRQNLVLLILIACVFQFILFYAPALAEDSVNIKNNINQAAAALDTNTLNQITKAPEAAESISTPKVVRESTHVMTAYNSEVGQTDEDPCTTANGFNLCKQNEENTIAANFLKFGTKVKIPELFGDKIFIVRDRMNKRHATRVDVWMKNHSDAVKFGIKVAKIQVIE